MWFIGLDVHWRMSVICILDQNGKLVKLTPRDSASKQEGLTKLRRTSSMSRSERGEAAEPELWTIGK